MNVFARVPNFPTKLSFKCCAFTVLSGCSGRDLWVMVVSASPYEHMIGKPDVKYVANMHGNEAVGRELMLHLIQVSDYQSLMFLSWRLVGFLTVLFALQYLVNSYSTDPYIKWLLDNTRIHILPSMNPDGFEVSREGQCDGGQGRYNARGFDLNRNFPDYFKQVRFLGGGLHLHYTLIDVSFSNTYKLNVYFKKVHS